MTVTLKATPLVTFAGAVTVKCVAGGGATVMFAVAAGDVEIGLQQTNVIQPVEGTQYLGPLPAELMEYGRFGVGLLKVSKEPEVAKAFIKFMAAPENADLVRKSTMETPQS